MGSDTTQEKQVREALNKLTNFVCKNGFKKTVKQITTGGTMFAALTYLGAAEELIVKDVVLGSLLVVASELRELRSLATK